MKHKYLLIAVVSALFAALCAFNSYASPFSGDANEIKLEKSSSSLSAAAKRPQKQKEGTSYGFFKQLCKKIKDSAQKLTDRLKAFVGHVADKMSKAGAVKKKPSFIARAINIPGHETNEMVFQGICRVPLQIEKDSAFMFTDMPYYLLSYYPKHSNCPSQLIVADVNSKKPIMRFALYESENKPYTGHAGGIAAAGKYIWVSSSNKLWGFDLQTVIDSIGDKSILAENNDEDKLPPSFKALPAAKLVKTRLAEVDSAASYVSFDGEYLWVGDFVKSSQNNYAPIPHHKGTWVAGYKVDSDGVPISKTRYSYKTASNKVKSGLKPDKIITCRESVQGFALCGDYAVLAISYGASNSKLAIYKNPLTQAPIKRTYKTEKGSCTADFWQINKDIHLTTLQIPAGAEDLEFDGRYLAVGFEGGSPNYKNRWALRPGVKIETNFYLIDLSKIGGL